MKKAALYLRSSKDRAEVGISIQQKELEKFAGREGYSVAEVFSDMELSGSGDETTRPGFRQLLALVAAKPRRIDAVLAVDTARIARDVTIATYFARECEKAGVEVRYSKIGVDGASATGEILLHMLRGFDRLHARMSADKGVAGQRANLERGFRAGGRAPMGYKLKHEATGASRGGNAVKKSTLVVDAAAAPKVKAFLQARALGVSRVEAARAAKLDQLAVGTLVGIERNALTYAGALVWNRYRKQRRSRDGAYQTMVPRPRSEWVIHEDRHAPLITRAEAERVLALIEGKPGRANPVAKPLAALLTGLLVDPAGRPFHYEAITASYRIAKGERVKAGWIDAEVLGRIAHDGAASEFVTRVVTEARRMSAAITDDPKVFDAKLTATRKQLKRLVDAVAAGGDLGPLRERIAELEQEEKKLAEERAQCAERSGMKRALSAVKSADITRLIHSLDTVVAREGMLDPERVAQLRTQLALLLERVTFDPASRELKIVYRLSPKLGRSWRPHGEA